jgi:hypothetical protein
LSFFRQGGAEKPSLQLPAIKEIRQQAVEKSVGMEMGISETFLGISKSLLLQSLISAVLDQV